MVGSSFDAHAPLDGFKLRGEDKLAFVSDMFDRVAPTYDLLNHFISLGQTTMWRLLALTRLGGQRGVLRPGAKILDVGCGTGWVTWFFGWYYRGMALDVEGMDCSKAGSTLQELPIEEGYWRADSGTAEFLQCRSNVSMVPVPVDRTIHPQ